MLVLLDSNVLASALVVRTSTPPVRVFDAVASGHQRLLLSEPLKTEYLRVLKKPDLSVRHRLDASLIDRLIDRLEEGCVFDFPPPAAHECPDLRDQMLWDLLENNGESVLVTGDRKLLNSQHFPGRILSPREFVTRHLGD